jgi:hypothetical protein
MYFTPRESATLSTKSILGGGSVGGAVDLLRGDKEIIFAVTREVLVKMFDFSADEIESFEIHFEATLISHMLQLIKNYEKESHQHVRNYFEVI